MLLIVLGDVARVNGQLAVSRAFGDKNLKTHLRSDPDIRYADIDPDTDFLILASDGLWKVTHLSLSLSKTYGGAYLYCLFSINPGRG
jgi:serine/threonine protein phosphatase PrpC